MNIQNAMKVLIFYGYLMCVMVVAMPLAFVENNQFKSDEIVVKRETYGKSDGILKNANQYAQYDDDDNEMLELAATHIFRPKLQNRVRKSAYTRESYRLPYYYTINYPINTLDI